MSTKINYNNVTVPWYYLHYIFILQVAQTLPFVIPSCGLYDEGGPTTGCHVGFLRPVNKFRRKFIKLKITTCIINITEWVGHILTFCQNLPVNTFLWVFPCTGPLCTGPSRFTTDATWQWAKTQWALRFSHRNKQQKNVHTYNLHY